MPYNRIKKAYTRKPPSGVKPNLGHPLARGLKVFIPFVEGGGAPSAYINGVRLSADTVSLHSTAIWEIDGDHGLTFRPATTASNSYLVWNSIPLNLGTGNFEYLVAFRHKVLKNSIYTAALNNYAPGFFGQHNATNYLSYFGSSSLLAITPTVGDFVVGNFYRAGTGTNEARTAFSANRKARYLDTHATRSNSIAASPNFTFNAATTVGGLNAQNCFSYSWLALWDRTLPNVLREELFHNPSAIWQIYSRPLPIWIPSGAAPPAWNNTINEIAAPGAVNEITNANIQSVNEI